MQSPRRPRRDGLSCCTFQLRSPLYPRSSKEYPLQIAALSWPIRFCSALADADSMGSTLMLLKRTGRTGGRLIEGGGGL